MRKFILLFVLCTSSLICKTSFAQVQFRANITIQPIWGPVGYDHVEYYYIPEIQGYYYVPRHKYIIMEDHRWVMMSRLPDRYRDLDLYRTRKVVINEDRPYLRHEEYRTRYESSHEFSDQHPIRDSHETRYLENRNHPEHSKWREQRRNEKQHHENHGNDHNDNHGDDHNGNGRRNN